MPDRPEVRVLGPVEVRRGGDVVPAGGGHQRTVLALLALAEGRVVSSDELAEAVWGDEAVARSRGTLQVYVSNLRRVLDAGPDAIVARPPGYALDVDAVGVDVQRFADALDDAQALAAADPAGAMDRLGDALRLWRGDVAGDLSDGHAFEAHRARLHELRLLAEEARWDAALAAERQAEVLAEIEQGCRTAPLREQRWATLMVALYRCDRQADALSAYQRAREVLVEELGIEPGPRLRRLEQEVLRQSDSLLVSEDEAVPSVAWLGADGERHVQRLESDRACRIGRDPDRTEVTLGWDPQVSRTHAEICAEDHRWILRDLGSTNGTSCNGAPVESTREVHDGDILRVGDTTILVRLEASPRRRRSFVVGETIAATDPE